MTAPILELPAAWYRAVGGRFFLRSRSLQSASPYTGGRNVLGPQVQVWACQVTFPPVTHAAWTDMEGFIARLDGQSGLLRMGDPWRFRSLVANPASGPGEPWSDDTMFADGTGWTDGVLPSHVHVASAAARGDDSIVIAGLPPSVTGVLSRGAHIEMRPGGAPTPTGNLYMLVGSVSSNAEGAARVSVRPRLRQGFAPGDMVVRRRATTVFQLADDEQGVMERDAADHGRAGLSLIEHVP